MPSDRPKAVSTMLVGSAKRVNGIGYARENPEHPAPGVRVPLAGPCVGNKSGKKQNNQDWVTPRCTNWCRMADLAMKTSGATKAAVRTVEPLTDYITHIRKTSTWFTGHVDSTDN